MIDKALLPRFCLLAGLLLAACGDSDEGSPASPGPTELPASFEVALEPVFEALTLGPLVEVGPYPGGRLFVAEQSGLVKLLLPASEDVSTLIDITEDVDNNRGEGLLSVALDPDFETNGHVWTYYFTAGDSATVLSRFEVVDDVADADTELRVLHLEQPGYNQNGGAIRFGPDGMLYLSLGDGSASLDPFRNGQDLSTLLGSVIRIDVRASTPQQPYAVPDDNPFLRNPDARAEIWAYGLRNPWRMAFDPQTGDLWLGDVGVSEAEELNRIERGGNYGWNVKEGFECLSGRAECGQGFTDPVAVYPHEEGRCSVIGGVVYRGESLTGLRGWYLFADHCTGEVLALDPENPGMPHIVVSGPVRATSFGTDEAGEVYVVDLNGGIWKLVEEGH